MTEKEFSYHLLNLDRHTSKVKAAFSITVIDLQKDIEKNSNLETVTTYLKAYDKPLFEKLLLSDCVSIREVFSKILDYISFFDFEIIKILTHIASKDMKKKFQKYKAMFKEYSKRRVVECPSDAFGDAKESEKIYIFKMDTILDSLTAEELKHLCYEIKAILKFKLLRLLKIKDGCAQLTFRGFEADITEEQQQELRNVGVLSISYGKVLDISKKFSEQKKRSIKCMRFHACTSLICL